MATVQGALSESQLTVTLKNVWVGGKETPMAFAQYFPPPDFSRGGTDDDAPNRSVSLQITPAQGDQTSPSGTAITIWRPPVLFVHGLCGVGHDWLPFLTLVNRNRFFVDEADYGYAMTISNLMPTYEHPDEILPSVTAVSMGFSFNAPFVLTRIDGIIANFRSVNQAAAAQADVAAHSMGGDITRTLEYLPGFLGPQSFQNPKIHKLITIGTPHLGSPLAGLLLSSDNDWVRNRLGEHGLIAIASATANGQSQTGGVADLAQGSSALSALTNLNTNKARTAMIYGVMTPDNTHNMVFRGNVIKLKLRCGVDPLANDLNPEGWNDNFGEPNDGIVPMSSQIAGRLGKPVEGVIHTSDLDQLGFTGPGELNSAAIVSNVIQLLNMPATASNDFYKLTQPGY